MGDEVSLSSHSRCCHRSIVHYNAMATIAKHSYLASVDAIPKRLLKIFTRYPSPALASDTPTPSTPHRIETPYASNAPELVDHTAPSPFQAWKHPLTGRWHNPKYSLRRQADLVKLAHKHGVEDLLPRTIKGTEERLQRRLENGLRVKGTGAGQRVKGKEWERTLKSRYVLFSWRIVVW